MTYKLTPQREGVVDAATGQLMDSAGVQRDVVLPPDHYQQRTGDITIVEIVDPSPAIKSNPVRAAPEPTGARA